MLEIPIWTIIVAEQIIITLIILSAVFFYKIKKLKRKISSLQDEISNQLESSQQSMVDASELTELQDKVALYEQSVLNLEKFRDMFFQMKRKYEAYAAMQQEMLGKMDDIVGDDHASGSLNEVLEKLKSEKEQLEQHLQQVEAELDMLMGHTNSPEANPEKIGENINGIHEMLDEQQVEIQRLKQYVVDLTLEAAIKEQIDNTLDGVDQKNKELAVALEILQNENQFLVDHIQALLTMDTESETGSLAELTELKEKLSKREKEYAELQVKFTTLETEYLAISEKQ